MEQNLETDCVAIEKILPPFRIGDRVCISRNLDAGSYRIVSMARHPGGGWSIEAAAANSRVVAHDSHFRACDAGWQEPPAQPSISSVGDVGQHGELSHEVAEQATQDAEFMARMEAWQEAKKGWLARLRAIEWK